MTKVSRSILGTVAGLVVCIILALSQTGCESGNAGEPLSSPVEAQRQSLKTYLYEHSTGRVDYWPTWAEVPLEFRYLDARFYALPARGSDVQLGLFRIRYAWNDLPQFSLHIKRSSNTKLLVYSHGHTGS